MRKALIPAVFVLSGMVATSVWSKVKWPCETSQAEMAGRMIGELLLRAANEWISTNGLQWVVRIGGHSTDVSRAHNDFASFLVGMM